MPSSWPRCGGTWGWTGPLLYSSCACWGGRGGGDLGPSPRPGRPIVALLAEALPFTLELAIYSLVLAVLIAIPMGTLAGTTTSRLADAGMPTLPLIGLSL